MVDLIREIEKEAEFTRLLIAKKGLSDPKNSFSRCWTISQVVVRNFPHLELRWLYGFKGVIAKDAHPWYSNWPKWCGHVVATNGKIVIDPTHSQFGSKYPGPFYSIEDASRLWKHMFDTVDEMPSPYTDNHIKRYGSLFLYEIER